MDIELFQERGNRDMIESTRITSATTQFILRRHSGRFRMDKNMFLNIEKDIVAHDDYFRQKPFGLHLCGGLPKLTPTL